MPKTSSFKCRWCEDELESFEELKTHVYNWHGDKAQQFKYQLQDIDEKVRQLQDANFDPSSDATIKHEREKAKWAYRT